MSIFKKKKLLIIIAAVIVIICCIAGGLFYFGLNGDKEPSLEEIMRNESKKNGKYGELQLMSILREEKKKKKNS